MPNFDGLLGEGSAARQLLVYGVGYEIARSLLGPLFTQIEYLINTNSPLVELSPADLADMVVRGIITPESDAAKRAAKYGIDADNFRLMTEAAGEPPGLVQVLEWWRRGYIPFDGATGVPSVQQAILTSRVYNYWTDTIRKAQFVPPSAADAVDAVLRNQITAEQGIALAFFFGLGVQGLEVPAGADTTDTKTAFQVLLDTRGNPPSLTELLELARRGEIPWGDLDPATKTANPAEISFAQGIYEGDSKDKWLPFYARLGVYLPPPRTIVTLLRDGVLTDAQALKYFEQAGLQPDLAEAYVASAHIVKSTAAKQLSASNIAQAYEDKLITEEQAVELFAKAGYDTVEAQTLLALSEFKVAQAQLTSAVDRVRSFYIGRKITADQAKTWLAQLGLPQAKVDADLQTWTVEQAASVRVLTPAQIADAWDYQVLTQDEAQAELEALGYVPFDAWTILSIKNKAALPGKPPRGPGVIT